VVAGAWTQANARFAERFSQRSGAGTGIPDAKESLKIWLDTANGIVKLFENACGAVDVSGRGGER
jgi:hypothetical protein